MAARIRHITVDCREPYALARFWADALGFVEDPANPNDPADPEALVVDPLGHHPGLLFLPVPEGKVAKNRLHLDLQPASSRDAEVERLVGLGATVVDDRRTPDGAGWVVMADPEGNELCVERSAAERGDSLPPTTTREAPGPEVRTGDERSMLTGMLDWYRAGVVRKASGVAPRHAAARPLPSATSISGVLKHLALDEDGWFTVAFAGRPYPEPWAGVDWDEDPDWEFHTAAGEPLSELVALYEAACARSREAIAGRGLDEVGADATRAPFTLRFALLHMIEETARHLGHLDVLREHLDGTTGE